MRCRSWPTRLKICDSLVVSDIKKQKHRNCGVFAFFNMYGKTIGFVAMFTLCKPSESAATMCECNAAKS